MHNVVYECYIYLCHNIAEILLMLALNTNQSTNISVISWLPVIVVKETGIPGGNHRPVASQ